jgi:hypothetical protein
MDALLASELHQLALHQASASDLASSDPLPDAALCNLDFLLSEPALLELALDALDGGRVLRVRGVGGSIVWQVVSSMVGRRGSRSGAPPRSGVVDGADLSGSGLCPAMDAGGAGPAYTVLLGGAGCCTCLDFRRRVTAVESTGRFCQHLLAAALANGAHAPRTRAVSDEELARLLHDALAAATSR